MSFITWPPSFAVAIHVGQGAGTAPDELERTSPEHREGDDAVSGEHFAIETRWLACVLLVQRVEHLLRNGHEDHASDRVEHLNHRPRHFSRIRSASKTHVRLLDDGLVVTSLVLAHPKHDREGVRGRIRMTCFTPSTMLSSWHPTPSLALSINSEERPK
jgi:hypothetical protein